MWHKLEVFVAIRHPFNLAWREFKQQPEAPQDESEDSMWYKHKAEIADEVVRHAHTPSSYSSKALMQMAMQPWKQIHYTQDDGVENMGIEEIKRICLHWLETKFK